LSSGFSYEYISGGFYLDYLRNIKREIAESLGAELPDLRLLSVFNVRKYNDNQIATDVSSKVQSLLAVYKNLINRGEPSLPSILVERSLLNAVSEYVQVGEKSEAGSIVFGLSTKYRKADKEKWLKALGKAHFVIDPRLRSARDSLINTFDSIEEKKFITEVITDYIGKHVWQLIEPQRPIESIIPNNEEFHRQRVDFAYESDKWKIVFEIDGLQHQNPDQKSLDRKRNSMLEEAGWNVIRIPAADIREGSTVSLLSKLRDSLYKDTLISITKENNDKPLWKSDLGIYALILVLSPFAVARMQWALIDALENGSLDLSEDEWKILVIERDVPFAKLALVDFFQHLMNLFDLGGIHYKLPKVKLTILKTEEFLDANDGVDDEFLTEHVISAKTMLIDEALSERNVDICLDVSILQKENFAIPGLNWYKQWLKPSGSLYITRSVHSYKEVRRIASTNPIRYEINESKKDSLRFFLQNIFRKEDFREGQFEVLRRSLALKPVIALLPTGAGKSLCYQMSALLQPGITIVVDPLKTLMLDQAENLKTMSIDNIEFINSDQSAKEREEVMRKFSQGKYKIIFVSPERFQIGEFRSSLKSVTVSNVIPYLVIDEAHCVSEWGHDFRTSYLNLARNARRYCSHKGYEPVVLALTGTASYAVLSDVQREIGVEGEDTKVQPETFDRKELHFHIEKVPSLRKREKLYEILKNLPKSFGKSPEDFFKANGKDTCSGIIFVPHVNGEFGAYELCGALRSFLKEQKARVEFFSGEVPKVRTFDYTKSPIMKREEYDNYKRKIQLAFKNNEFPLLVATKTFGMGIDKPNIRYTIHYGIPQSLEAFYQEAGRAGRDRKNALCTIIFSDDPEYLIEQYFDISNDADKLNRIAEPSWSSRGDVSRMMYFHKNSFRGIRVEGKEIHDMLEKNIVPVLSKMHVGEYKKINIPFSSNSDQINKEKAIYRMSLVGLVDDYTIDYNGKSFEIEICKREDQEYVEILKKYIGRYKTEEYVRKVPELLQKENGKNVLEKAIGFAIRFVYEEIERKRRRALENMAEVARTSKNGEEIRRALLAYLETSPFSAPLREIAKKIDPEQWWSILDLLEKDDNVDTPRQLLGSCMRVLESNPDHPGLLILTGVGNLLVTNVNEDTGYSSIKSGLEELKANGYSDEQLRDIALELFSKFYQIAKRHGNFDVRLKIVAEAILDSLPHKILARKLYKYLPEKASYIILKSITEKLKEFNNVFIGGES